MPGAVLALVIFTCLDILFPGVGQALARETSNSTGPPIVAFLLTAYILGSVIRLWSADPVDQLSASRAKVGDLFEGTQRSVEENLKNVLKAIEKVDPKRLKYEEYFEALLKLARNPDSEAQKIDGSKGSDVEAQVGQGYRLITWVWKYDQFPYPVLEILKLRLYHPDEEFPFFEPYKHCFAAGPGPNKGFFDYCKAVIYDAHEGNRHALAEEVQRAEAQVRFFAGVFWALLLSSVALVLTTVLLVGRSATGLSFGFIECLPLVAVLLLAAVAAWVFWKANRFVRQTNMVTWFWCLSSIAASLLFAWATVGAFFPGLKTPVFINFVAFGMLTVAFFIVAGGRFRGHRTKEVDMVFDAFVLMHRPPDQCPNCGSELSSNTVRRGKL